jgi:hypothetical protein
MLEKRMNISQEDPEEEDFSESHSIAEEDV